MNLGVTLLIIAVVVIIGILAGVVIFRSVRRRLRNTAIAAEAAAAASATADKNAKLLRWIEAIEAAKTDQAIRDIGVEDYWAEFDPNPARLQAARDKYYAAMTRLKSIKFYDDQVSVAKTPGERALLAFRAYESSYDLHLALGLPEGASVSEYFLQQLAETFRLFYEGSELAKIDYENVMDAYRFNQFCKEIGIAVPPFPAEWEDAVTKHVRTPVVEDFRLTPRLSSSEVRAQAAEAIATRDQRKAKLVLAYCEVREEVTGYGRSQSRQVLHPYVTAIGDVMLAQISMLAHEPDRFDQYMRTFAAISLQKS